MPLWQGWSDEGTDIDGSLKPLQTRNRLCLPLIFGLWQASFLLKALSLLNIDDILFALVKLIGANVSGWRERSASNTKIRTFPSQPGSEHSRLTTKYFHIILFMSLFYIYIPHYHHLSTKEFQTPQNHTYGSYDLVPPCPLSFSSPFFNTNTLLPASHLSHLLNVAYSLPPLCSCLNTVM